MSRGLGKVQREILEALARTRRPDGWAFLSDLIYRVYYPNQDSPPKYTRSQFVVIHKAVKALEERRLVETKRYTSGMLNFSNGPGGETIAKKVKLIKS